IPALASCIAVPEPHNPPTIKIRIRGHRLGRGNSFLQNKILPLVAIFAVFVAVPAATATYVGSATVASPNSSISSAALEILGSGGGSGSFVYKGGGNAVDAIVAAALSACVVNSGNCSLGGYGGHMLIWKAGWDGNRNYS